MELQLGAGQTSSGLALWRGSNEVKLHVQGPCFLCREGRSLLFSNAANPSACALPARMHFATEIGVDVAQVQFSLPKPLGAADGCVTTACCSLKHFCVYCQPGFSPEDALCLLFPGCSGAFSPGCLPRCSSALPACQTSASAPPCW